MTRSDQVIRELIGALEAGTVSSVLLDRAAAVAVTTRDRQLVAIVAAHLAGDADRARLLARDHLADYPDSPLGAWIAAATPTATPKESR